MKTGRPDKPAFEPLRIGISACLLGQEVRYDGGHKRDPFLTETLGRYVEWVAVCPEVELGLGTPRETLRLEKHGNSTQLIMPKSGANHTEGMLGYAERRTEQLEKEDLDGYILKKDSPSCGMEKVRIYDSKGSPSRTGRGLFAEILIKHFPHLPVEEEGRLHDPRLRENFISRMFAYQRWRNMLANGIDRARLMHFHQQHKFLLMAHEQRGTALLGRLLGKAGATSGNKQLAQTYLEGFSQIMRRTPTVRGHTNVLQHIAGYVPDHLDPEDRQELAEMIQQYRRGLLPLIVPVTLLRHYVRKFEISYLEDQVYLSPHPHELMLLNQL
jgi:uncharacterized protein YbgA (DUF1722 family)/uncharacterized protein YbbK (DUF523 family)